MTIMSDNWISKKVKEERIIEPFESDQVKKKEKYHTDFLVLGMMQE